MNKLVDSESGHNPSPFRFNRNPLLFTEFYPFCEIGHTLEKKMSSDSIRGRGSTYRLTYRLKPYTLLLKCISKFTASLYANSSKDTVIPPLDCHMKY
jgi:hypothetical protein